MNPDLRSSLAGLWAATVVLAGAIAPLLILPWLWWRYGFEVAALVALVNMLAYWRGRYAEQHIYGPRRPAVRDVAADRYDAARERGNFVEPF